MKTGWKVAIAAGLVLAGNRLFAMNQMRKDLRTFITAKVHQVTLAGVTVRVDALIRNPTNGSLKIRYPFVEIFYGEATEPFATSRVIDNPITIPKYGEVNIKQIMIDVPLLKLLSVAGNIAKEFMSGARTLRVKFGVKAPIYTGIGDNTVPYQYDQEITLDAQSIKLL